MIFFLDSRFNVSCESLVKCPNKHPIESSSESQGNANWYLQETPGDSSVWRSFAGAC